MLKLYLKQAWTLLRQNPLFSGLYIAGTGLAIAMEPGADAVSDPSQFHQRAQYL